MIVPVFNSETTISKCLASVASSTVDSLEVLVVNDGSTDKSRGIILEFKCQLIDLDKNQGRANARNVGASHATGDILIFIDSDIVIPADALGRAVEIFQSNRDAMAVNGVLRAEVEGLNFVSTYKNLYMNYNFRQMPEQIDFIFSSFVAIKKEYFLPFKDYKATDDTELGMRMIETFEKNIILAKDIEVSHLKRYSFTSLLQNDFRVAKDWASIFLKHKSYRNIFQKKRFAHANLNQLVSLLFVGLAMISFVSTPVLGKQAIFTCFSSIVLAPIIRTDYFMFVFNKTGVVFLMKAVGLFFVDSLAHISGIVIGFIVPARKIN